MHQAFTANRIERSATLEQCNLIANVYQRSGAIFMTTKLSKWGNSLGLRLPKYVEERLQVGAGDYVFVKVTDANEIVVRPVKQKGTHLGDATPRSTGNVIVNDDELDDW